MAETVDGYDAQFWNTSYTSVRDAVIQHLEGHIHEDDVAEEAIIIDAIERAAADLYVPGTWGCPECHFVQVRLEVSAVNGNARANKAAWDQRCPNDGERMRRVTWKERAADLKSMLDGVEVQP